VVRSVWQVTKRVETAEEKWRGWNWRSEGDIMVNGAFFVASGEGVEVKYEKAYSVEPKSVVLIDQIVMHAGVLGVGGRFAIFFLTLSLFLAFSFILCFFLLSFYFFLFFIFPFYFCSLLTNSFHCFNCDA